MARPPRVIPAFAAAVLAACGGGSGGGDTTPDTTPPSITIVAPVAGETYATATVTLRALVSDGGGLASVEYSVDGGARATLPAASGGYEVSVPLPAVDGVPLTLEVFARDRAGHTAQATRNIRVDRVAPVVNLAGADAACPDACTGTVLRAADGPLHVTGTATDGSGVSSVLVLVHDEGNAEVASATVPVDAGGAFAWDWDPFSDGRFFTIAARADDPKGNTGTATRVAYVDRVAPTVASGPPVIGAPRSGPLVSFSEAMVLASVEAVTTISVAGGGPLDTALAWADARSFGFAPALAPFTSYALAILEGATDRAGNPLSPAPVGFNFETEMIPPPVDPAVVATGARSPRIGLFGDGRPVVVYGTEGSPRWVRWDGRGGWADEVIPNAALAGGVAADLETSLFFRTVSAVFSVPSGGAADLYYGRSDGSGWTGWADGSDPDLVASATLSAWSPAFGVETLLGPPWDLTVLFGDAGGAKYVIRNPSGWSAPNLVKATAAGASGGGNAFLDDRVYYLDTHDLPFFEAVTNTITGVGRLVGAEGWRTSDIFYRARPDVLYTTVRAGPPPGEDLHFACDSATPWREAVTPLSTRADALALAVSSTTAAVAVALADGTVLFGTTPNGDDICLADPQAPAWDPQGAVTDAREPAVALGPDGVTVWKAWVRASTGELVISR